MVVCQPYLYYDAADLMDASSTEAIIGNNRSFLSMAKDISPTLRPDSFHDPLSSLTALQDSLDLISCDTLGHKFYDVCVVSSTNNTTNYKIQNSITGHARLAPHTN